MKTLVTTSFSTLAIDIKARRGFAVERGRGLYYGLAKTPNGIAVGARRRMMSSAASMFAERGCIILLGSNKSRETIEAPFPLRDTHGIAYFDDALWITCSRDDCVAVLRDGHWTRWYPLGPQAEPDVDRNHFNTILAVDETIYLLAHRFGDSEVLCFQKENLALKEKHALGNQSHDIWFDNGQMRVCSSGEGRILGLDGLSIDVGAFPRGHVEIDGHHLVGLNEPAPRAIRDSTAGKLLLMTGDYKPVEEFGLSQEGMVLDLIELDDFEYRMLESFGRDGEGIIID